MIEAQIICCEKCEIPDLGLSLMPGEERWVSDALANSSKDLRRAKGMGKVRVYRRARRMSQNPKRPPPPFVARSRPPARQRAEPEVVERVVEVERTVEVEKTVVQEVDTERLKAELLGDLLPGLRAVVAEEMGKAMAQTAQAPAHGEIDPEQLESVLEKVVRRAMPAGARAAAGDSRSPEGPEEPVFIPGKIVDKDRDTRGKISVKTTTSDEATDVDEAHAALREMRRLAKKQKQEK